MDVLQFILSPLPKSLRQITDLTISASQTSNANGVERLSTFDVIPMPTAGFERSSRQVLEASARDSIATSRANDVPVAHFHQSTRADVRVNRSHCEPCIDLCQLSVPQHIGKFSLIVTSRSSSVISGGLEAIVA